MEQRGAAGQDSNHYPLIQERIRVIENAALIKLPYQERMKKIFHYFPGFAGSATNPNKPPPNKAQLNHRGEV